MCCLVLVSLQNQCDAVEINCVYLKLQGDDSKKGKKKKSTDLIELPIDSELPGNTDVELQRYRDEEVSSSFQT